MILTQDAGEVINLVNVGMQDVVKLMTTFSQVKINERQYDEHERWLFLSKDRDSKG